MSNQTWVYLIQSDAFLAHDVSSTWDFDQDCEVPLPQPLPLLIWVQTQLACAATENDEDQQHAIKEDVLSYVLEHQPGMHNLTTFETSWALANDIAVIRPHLHEQFHARLDHLVGRGGNAAPITDNLPLIILDGCNSIWTFFRREEIMEIAPLIQSALNEHQSDSLDYEWKDILTSDQNYHYDWLAFVYPFA